MNHDADFWIVMLPCIAVTLLVICLEARERKTKRIKAERDAANLRNIANARSAQAEERLGRANAARTRRESSPASQRTPAPWFGGEAS